MFFSQKQIVKVIENNQYLNSFIKDKVREFMKSFLETILEQEIKIFIGREKYERKKSTVKKYRNGTRQRNYLTLQAGMIKLSIPRCRGYHFTSVLLNKRSITQQELEDVIVQIWSEGSSYRDLQNLIRKIYGEYFCLKTFHTMIKRLDEYVAQYHNREIKYEYDCIFIDGLEISIKGLPKKYHKEYYRNKCKNAVKLAVLGQRREGKKIIKEIIDYKIAISEDEFGYTELLRSLKNRGLTSDKIKVVIHDGEASISKALKNVYGRNKIQEQRCMIHRLRNILNCLRNRYNKEELNKDVWEVYSSTTKEEFHRKQSIIFDKWKIKEPEAMEIFNKTDENLLTKYNFEVHIHKSMHSNNTIERYFREIRRRTKVIGAFENVKSADRLLFLTIEYLNQRRGSVPTNSNLKFTH